MVREIVLAVLMSYCGSVEAKWEASFFEETRRHAKNTILMRMFSEVKAICGGSFYVGIDVGDYNQSNQSKSLMDKYIVSKPESFADDIKNMGILMQLYVHTI